MISSFAAALVCADQPAQRMLLDDLKQQTRQQHTALEQLNGLPVTRSDYLNQLEAFYGFIGPWERQLAAELDSADPIRARRQKTGWLEADLASFGYSADEIANLPHCTDLPSTASRAEILGAAYVLEGSTLGGQFIAKHLEHVLGLAPGTGDRYFRSYGPEVGPMWQAFRQELLRHSSPANDPVIVGAARDAFAKLHAWFATRKVAA